VHIVPRFGDIPDLWERDGSLRDVCFQLATPEHWEKFVTFARRYPLKYTVDGEERELPHLNQVFADREEHATTVAILLDGVRVHCHFSSREAIELDIDPREITGVREHDVVLHFMAELSVALNQEAIVSPEGGENSPYMTYDLGRRAWRIHPTR
jgi:hypothetical protein